MTLPGLIFGTLVGVLVGGLLHLIVGGNLGRLVLYIIFGIVGFWVGHLLAVLLGITFFSVGPVHLGMAFLVSVVITLLGYWLSLVQTGRK